MRKAIVTFVTSNTHKVDEVKYALRNYPFEVKHINAKKLEIQAGSVEKIAEYSAFQVAKDYQTPIFVEDTGLFIRALNGFPGPYSAYSYATIGASGVLKLLEGLNDRRATFISAVAFHDLLSEKTNCFIGNCAGNISLEARGNYGFGFDSIFEPSGGTGKTFAEMPLEEKSILSHRCNALQKFAEWYLKRLYS